MNARRIEERREIFMGQELVYHVMVIDPCPPPSDQNPYGDGGRCFSEATATQPNCKVASERSPEKRTPSKAEYIRSFALAGKLPVCVQKRRADVEFRLNSVASYFRLTHRRPNARLVRALAWYDAADLACIYDTGRIARIRHHFEDHKRRVARLDTFASELFSREGRVRPGSVAAVLICKASV